MRLVQFWVPDIRRPEFARECRRQSLLAAVAERTDASLTEFLDNALSDLDRSG